MVIKLTIIQGLEPFLNKPFEKLHLAEISRELKQPHPTVRQWLNELERIGVLIKEFKGRLTLYSVNIGNPNIGDYLVIAEKNKLIKHCDRDSILAELVSFINKRINSDVLIFGSATEKLSKAEDIDLLVIGKSEFRDISKKLGKELHIIEVSNLNKVTKTLKNEIIKKHLLINNSEKFVGWMFLQN